MWETKANNRLIRQIMQQNKKEFEVLNAEYGVMLNKLEKTNSNIEQISNM